MAGYVTNLPLDGTAAMKPFPNADNTHPRIIAFPSRNRPQLHDEKNAHDVSSVSARVSSWLRGCLLSSEMYCSLLREDARGVAYKLFSKHNLGTLMLVSFVVAVLSIAYGA